MQEVILEVVSNKRLTDMIYLMTLKGDLKEIKNPGEFVEVKLDSYYLRRPISVCDYDANKLVLLYKVLGKGTKSMTEILPHTKLNILIGLGNGFTDLSKKPLIIAGGIGVAPFVALVKKFNNLGIKPLMIYGEQTRDNFVLLDFFKENTKLYLTTDDGSCGFKGHPLALLENSNLDYDKFYACGPLRMLEGLHKNKIKGYISLEARMGCGFGACMGCSIKTTSGFKRVCKEGPIFNNDEVIYE